jgi:hypothetical protein
VPIGEDRYAEERPGTLIRYHHLERLLLTHRGHFSPDDAKTVLRSHFNAPLAVCCHDVVQDPILGPQGTLSSVAMDLAARTMQVTDGSPCHAPYEDVPVPVPVHGGLSTH